MNLFEKILVGWVVIFALPKLIFVPMFRAMYTAMAWTDRQDEIDAEWLAAYERRQSGGGDDGSVRHRHRRRPRPTRPRRPGGLNPVRHGAVAVRKRRERSEPVRAVSR